MKPVVIIPAYNPDDRLLEVVKPLNDRGLKIVIVDDGSSTDRRYIFKKAETEFGCEVCRHLQNKGKGAALKTGIKYASEHYPDICGYVTADADGQHLTQDIIKIAEVLENNPQCLILGVRNFNFRNTPLRSILGNRIASFVFMLNTGRWCKDTQTGLRGIPLKYLDICLATPGDRYEYEMNFLLEIAKNGGEILTIPISTVYFNGNNKSHFNPFLDSIRIYLNIFKYSLSSLVSSFVDLTLFTLIVGMLNIDSGGILVATVTARTFSGLVNFLFNKHWVFQSKKGYKCELVKYFVLFFAQMMFSGMLVTILSKLPLPLIVVKVCVDTALFLISVSVK